MINVCNLILLRIEYVTKIFTRMVVVLEYALSALWLLCHYRYSDFAKDNNNWELNSVVFAVFLDYKKYSN